jgi:hypothetical protein
MEKKLKMTPRDLILGSKDYSKLTKDELIVQYQIIMNQYNEFKNLMTANVDSRNNGNNIVNIKNAQKRIQKNMYSKVLAEVDNHLKIMKDLIEKL